ncbi:MAG: GC-type dockerin domain-anchored protein, partial [Planctomycetota bacterium]|nr:GC-type dockerin domain-anchored protein [Planctomycetota bacterium]
AERGRAMVWAVAGGALLYDRQIADGGIEKVVWTQSESELLALGSTSVGELIFSAWDIVEDRTVLSIPPSESISFGGLHDFDFDRASSVWALTTGNGSVEAFGPGLGCVSDLDGSGTVDGSDLAMVLSAWDRANTTADQNGDGVVNGVDLSYLLTNWGACGD